MTEKIIAAQKITDMTFDFALKNIREDMTEQELCEIIDSKMLELGAEGFAFDTIVAFSENAVDPNAVPSGRKLKKGDLVLMDFGAKLDGYCSDMTRTVAYYSVSDEQRQAYDAVLFANKTAINAIKPDVLADEVHKICAEALGDELSQYFIHGTGHGVGREVHEEPYLSTKGIGVPLAVGQVVTVEPGVYIPDKFGIRIEDMVLITENGSINLTKSPKELIIIK